MALFEKTFFSNNPPKKRCNLCFDGVYPAVDISTEFTPPLLLRKSLFACRVFDSAQTDRSQDQIKLAGLSMAAAGLSVTAAFLSFFSR
ncbi:MAG: hypothetical protein A2W93_04635 [Bacteroidetes bacterium GWF2_43_63]|nr:MAG: hypothetical protein A2W94_12625 [Bacteroidetes bacterium GWE2_42_42]OFY56046.1 MAG: hypothetical protein A2W93_04635 [Bacteroidetes bacterium GWF2_43_63]HBG70707.1 hypothetical protein [Bacteroidales bacterium]HCB62465.1 hypothetical protein [Bacteroidales bacterium]HCY21920.1 hypothetical protein [Bacteroidales bacterium]